MPRIGLHQAVVIDTGANGIEGDVLHARRLAELRGSPAFHIDRPPKNVQKERHVNAGRRRPKSWKSNDPIRPRGVSMFRHLPSLSDRNDTPAVEPLYFAAVADDNQRGSQGGCQTAERKVPWRLGLVFAGLFIAMSACSTTVGLLAPPRFEPPFDSEVVESAAFRVMRQIAIGMWALLAAYVVLAYVGMGRRKALASLRAEAARTRWWLWLLALVAGYVLAGLLLFAVGVVSTRVS